MRVLIVSQQVRNVRSGVGTYARVLLEGLPFRPAVATWSRERDERLDAEWIDLGEPPLWDPTPGAFWSLGRAVADTAGEGFDVVHFLDAREAYAFRGAGRLVGTVHDDYAVHAPRWPWGLQDRAADPLRRWIYYRWLARLERRCYPRFDVLLANSAATGRSLHERHHVAAERIRTIPLTISPAGRAAEPERLEGEPALLFAGGNFYRKGLDTIVRSLPEVAADRPRVHLHVAGRDPAQGRILSAAQDLGVAERVTFHGHLRPERVRRMMAGADLFVMPSRREALGLVYLEAARAGLPVIAGERGGVADIVRHGESGWTVPAEDPGALASAILRLCGDSVLVDLLVAGARVELAARTPERLLEETLAAYRGAPVPITNG